MFKKCAEPASTGLNSNCQPRADDQGDPGQGGQPEAPALFKHRCPFSH
ncbi:hypothetical protein SynA1560_00255 [Synechococcus sp. A15-60]|nr:hypothetical protein SynA1560_00255 [Synechococcus sp. A15-60]